MVYIAAGDPSSEAVKFYFVNNGDCMVRIRCTPQCFDSRALAVLWFPIES